MGVYLRNRFSKVLYIYKTSKIFRIQAKSPLTRLFVCLLNFYTESWLYFTKKLNKTNQGLGVSTNQTLLYFLNYKHQLQASLTLCILGGSGVGRLVCECDKKLSSCIAKNQNCYRRRKKLGVFRKIWTCKRF